MAFLGKKRVGVLGLGLIGSRVAANLRHVGYPVFVWNRSPRAQPNFLGSIEQLARQCHVIQIFVADDAALESCVDELAGVVSSKHTILNHATVSPQAAEAAAEKLVASKAKFLNAPFTGSKKAAEDAMLVYYVGGQQSDLDPVRNILDVTSRKIIYVGSVANAAVIKIVTNMMSGTINQVLAEALALAKANGVRDEAFAEALEWNAARSGVSDLKLQKMLESDYEPHFALRHMLKDVSFGLDLAEDLGWELPVTNATAACLLASMSQGDGDLDFAAVYKNFGLEGEQEQTGEEAVEQAEATDMVAESDEGKTPEDAAAEPDPVVPEDDKKVDDEAKESDAADNEQVKPLYGDVGMPVGVEPKTDKEGAESQTFAEAAKQIKDREKPDETADQTPQQADQDDVEEAALAKAMELPSPVKTEQKTPPAGGLVFRPMRPSEEKVTPPQGLVFRTATKPEAAEPEKEDQADESAEDTTSSQEAVNKEGDTEVVGEETERPVIEESAGEQPEEDDAEIRLVPQTAEQLQPQQPAKEEEDDDYIPQVTQVVHGGTQ